MIDNNSEVADASFQGNLFHLLLESDPLSPADKLHGNLEEESSLYSAIFILSYTAAT